MQIQILRTSDLDSRYLESMASIYSYTFNHSVSPSQLKKKYSSSLNGDSWHGLVLGDDDVICGTYTYFVKSITFKGKKIILFLSIDTCFPYAGIVSPFAIKSLALKLLNTASLEYADSLPMFVCGFPNSNYEKFALKVFSWEYVSRLSYKLSFLPLINILKRSSVNCSGLVNTSNLLCWVDLNPMHRLTSFRLISNVQIGSSLWDIDILKKPFALIPIFRLRGCVFNHSHPSPSDQIGKALSRFIILSRLLVFITISFFPGLVSSTKRSFIAEKPVHFLRFFGRFMTLKTFPFYLKPLNSSAISLEPDIFCIPVDFLNDVP